MPSDEQRGRLPFEPRKNKKKNKSEPTTPAVSATPVKQKSKSTSRNSRPNSNLSAIPDVVSKRMGQRMAVFCGIPSALGMSSLFIFYWLKTKEVVDLPPYAAFAVSLGLLGLGVIGLSYGLFSASWDEDRAGSIWGADEFKINLGRTRDAWKESKKSKAD
ncbi:MAG: PAM68 family protein [Cyanobacteria bacterium P01_G01_bin.39]